VFEFGREFIESYDRSLDLAGGQLRNQPGRRSHVCFETDTGYMVVDVWESLEAFEAFGELLNEIVTQLPGPVHVKLHPVHNLI
jgi:heme-degrading monooxygenase HmoA